MNRIHECEPLKARNIERRPYRDRMYSQQQKIEGQRLYQDQPMILIDINFCPYCGEDLRSDRDRVIAVLEADTDQNTQIFYMGKRVFSPREMIEEVRRGSKIGLRFVEMYQKEAK
jgi:hypothetical protein